MLKEGFLYHETIFFSDSYSISHNLITFFINFFRNSFILAMRILNSEKDLLAFINISSY